MNKKTAAKRVLSLVLAMCMIFSILPSAGAADWTVTATPAATVTHIGIGDEVAVGVQVKEGSAIINEGVSVTSCVADKTDIIAVKGNSTDGFTITPIAEGKATVTLTASYNGDKKNATMSVDVKAPSAAIPLVLEMGENIPAGNLTADKISYSANGWEVDAAKTAAGTLSTNGWFKFNDSKTDIEDCLIFRLSKGTAIGFKFYVPVEGEYALEVTENGFVTANLDTLDVSVFKNESGAYTQIGETWNHKLTGELNAPAVTYMPDSVTLQKGWHTVVFANVTGGNQSFRFKRVAFIPVAEKRTITLAENIDYAVDTMLLENQAKINTHGWAIDKTATTYLKTASWLRANNVRMRLGERATYKFYLPEGKYAISANIGSAAESTGKIYIDGAEENAKIIPATAADINLGAASYSAGYHTITIENCKDAAYAQSATNFYPYSFTINQAKEGDVGYSLEASISEKLRYTGDSAQINLKATGIGEELDPSALSVSYITNPSNVVEISDAGVITAVGAGTAEITISTMYANNKEAVTYDFGSITVATRPTEQQPVVINMYKGMENQTAIYDIATIDNNNYEVCPSPETTSRILSSPTHFRTYTDSFSMRMTGLNEQVTLKTYIPVAGEYKLNLRCSSKHESGGDLMISVADVDGVYTEVGDYSFKTGADGSTAGENIYVGTVSFATPGYKKIKLQRINADGTNNANFYPAEFTFVPNAGEGSASLEARLTGKIKYTGHKTGLSVKLADGDVTIPSSRIKFTYTDAKNLVKVSEDGTTVTAIAAGTTELVVSCVYAGKTLTCSVPITVEEMPKIGEDLVINFNDPRLLNPVLAGSVPATIEEHGWQIDASNKNRRWYYKADHLQMRMDPKADDLNNYYAAFGVEVPISGYYQFEFTSHQRASGAAALRLLVNDQYVGDYDFDPYPEATGSSEMVCMNTVWLEGGYQVIKLKWTKGGDAGNIWVRGFTLRAVEAMPVLESVVGKIGKKRLYPGEKTSFSAKAMMNNGNAYFFDSLSDSNKMTYSVSDNDILSVSPDGTVTALKPGTAQVIATAVVDGKEESGSVEVVVTENYIKNVYAVMSSNKIFPEDVVNLTFNVTMDDEKSANLEFVDIQIEVINDKIVVDKESRTLTAISDGESGFNLTATLAGKSMTVFVPVTVRKRVLELHHVEVSAEKNEIKVGETLQIIAQGIQFNGEPADISELEIFYDTQDNSIAEVSDAGVVTALSEGETDVVVHIRKGTFIRSATFGIKINGYVDIESAEIKFRNRVYVGSAAKAEVVATLAGGAKITVPSDKVVYEIKNAEPVGCASVDADGVVTASESGRATLSATVMLGDAPVHADGVDFTISGAQVSNSIIIDFMKYKEVVETLTPLDIEIEKEGWEINVEKTSNYMMSLNGGSQGRFAFYKGSFNTMAQVLDVPTIFEGGKTNNSSDLAFDVEIPEKGVYALSVGGLRYNSGCLTSVYIDGEYIGNYDFDMENRGGTFFNCINLDAGIHTVTFRAITGSRSSDKYHFINIGSLIFNRVATGNAFVELEAEAESSYLIVGETVNVTAKAKMADGKYFNFDPSDKWESASSINITSSDSNIVAVNADGTITAKAEGSANITVDALVEGVRIVESFPITVDGEKLATIEAHLNGDLIVGTARKIVLVAKTESGRTINVNSLENLTTSSSDGEKVKVEGLDVYGLSAGSATLSGSAEINGNKAEFELKVTASEPMVGRLELKADVYVMRPSNTDGLQLSAIGYDANGNLLDLSNAGVIYKSLTPSILAVTEGGLVTPAGENGSGTIHATISIGEATLSAQVVISVREGKVNSTYYTAEKVATARENIQKYSWANSTAKAAVNKAEKYLELTDFIWENITTQELPRNTMIGHMDDPGRYTCKYCGADMSDRKYSSSGYGWLIDPINAPWKIQCAECRRRFPSNDFWSFYQLGVENGVWSYERSLEENEKLIEAGQEGYLVNKLYPEKDTELGVDGWAVDDGYGYKPGNYIDTGDGLIAEEHTYIAYYNLQGIFSTQEGKPALLYDAVTSLRDAYLYTGDIKYGRVGAIILDRLADVYPAMDCGAMASHWGMGVNQARGKITSRIPEPTLIYQYILAYDAFFNAYDDAYVVDYLSKRAAQNNMENDKTTPEKIRKNLEDGILRAAKAGCDSGQINGNFGNNSMVVSAAALILDNNPETLEWIEWLNKPEETWAYPVNGGSIMPQLMEIIDRDGFGDEGAITYNMWWSRTLSSTAQALKLYSDAYPNADVFNLYEEPKYKKTLLAELPILLSRNSTPHVGDGGQTASVAMNTSLSCNIDYFQNTGDVDMAKAIYLQQMYNSGSLKNLRYDIFTKNPESLADDILKIVREHGEYDVNKSISLQGFGFSILKDGAMYKDVMAGETANNQRNFWISWIRGYGHRHPDKLNLGIEAWGLNIAPDMGYTQNSWGDEYTYWGHSTLSHNTVVVNEQSQLNTASTGTLLHFDDGGDVQLMDVDGKEGYPTTDIYRRSLVMINVDDTISYGVDFFRVRGGYDHLYSFHALSDNVTLDVETVKQTMGSYAGPDVPWGTSPTYTAYSWLDNVRRAKNPQTGEFSADFKIRDFRNTLGKGQETNYHLRMTMLNDYDLDEITAAAGYPSQYRGNPETMEWVLARRSGKQGDNLDTLFTTVFEPYEGGKKYITALEQVPAVEIKGGGRPEHGRDDQVKAVKVTLDGRTDYIVYATNTDILYRVDDKFDFQGFMGVYTISSDGEILRKYAHDATLIEAVDVSEDDRDFYDNVTGEVADFTRSAEFENYITITNTGITTDEEAQDLTGKYVFIENDGTNCAAYEIKGVDKNGDDIKLDIGDITLIRRYIDNEDLDAGFEYDISVGDKIEIRNRIAYDSTPKFVNVSDKSVSAENRFSLTMQAISPLGKKVTYSSVNLPRGASVDSETGVVSWTPSSSQVGEYHFAIKASDGSLSSVASFQVTVHKSVSGGGSNDSQGSGNQSGTTTPPAGDSGAGAGGGAGAGAGSSGGGGGGGASGGGGGGGGAPSGGETSEPTKPEETTLDTPAIEDNTGAVTSDKFVDLGSHTWAKDAIYALVDAGVVNGTSENTYSPAKNIKRADFAIMLVRAFDVAGGEGEQFADVDSSKYYAKELLTAKVNGIVGGIGDNKFNPEGEISRQDMMVMLSRALEAQGKKLAEADESVLAQFADAAELSDYAKAAVASVVKAGIITGSNGRINPLAKATRAEIAVMLERVLK